tara:strand:- start:276 stop:1184 length:909 start_codon:yes stop_codon:yes gene_type:complete
MISSVIGSTKISQIHLRSLIKYGFKKIYLITRNINKSKKIICEKKLKQVNVFASNYKILDKLKFEVINICVGTNFHDVCLDYINKSNALIMVEKPIVSLNKFKKNYINYLDKIYKKHKKLVVCYPMQFLAKSFLTKFKIPKNIKKIEVFYNTRGNNEYENICEDLLPHGLSLVQEIMNKSKFSKKIKKIFYKVRKNKWNGVIQYDNLVLKFNFKQSKLIKKSNFYFKLNEIPVQRTTKTKNNIFLNFLKYKKEKTPIKNPMDQFIINAIKNRKNKNLINKNKNLTYEIMKINYLFLLNKTFL